MAVEPIGTTSQRQSWQSLFAGGSLLMAGMMIANVLNFLFNAFLGRMISLSQLSAVALVSTFWNVALLFLGAYAASLNHTVSYLTARNSHTRAAMFRRRVSIQAIGITVIVAVIWTVAIPFLTKFFHLDESLVAVSAIPVFILGLILYTNIGYFEGRTLFGLVGILYIVEALSKLAAAVLVVRFHYQEITFLVVPFSVAVAAAVSVAFSWATSQKPLVSKTKPEPFPISFFAASLLAGISVTIFTSIDIILAKHYLTPAMAGEYSLLALFGKIIFFLGSLPSALIITFTSRSIALKTNPLKVLVATFLGTSALIGIGLIALGPFGEQTAKLLLGDRALYVLPHLAPYAWAMAIFTLSNTIILYHVARKHYAFAWASLLQALFIVLAIAYHHDSIDAIVYAMKIAGEVSFAVIFLLQLTVKEARNNIVRIYGRT